MKKHLLSIGVLLTLITSKAQISTFDDLSLPKVDTFWNGSEITNGFTSGKSSFSNSYSIESWGISWSGFAYSNMTDTLTAGSSNQYSSNVGHGYNNSENYAVVNLFGKDAITYQFPKKITGFYITNSLYADSSMTYGDQFAKKFGGETGNDKDWFLLTTYGYNNGIKTDSVNFYLADFRFDDNNNDYIVRDWAWVDLTTLGLVDSVRFSLSSSDSAPWGINTPNYFCMDDFTHEFNTTDIGIDKESELFTSWATKCEVERGYVKYEDPTFEFENSNMSSFGTESEATGIVDNKVVSLGDGGSAILSFQDIQIQNGEGPDFAVFENGFSSNGDFLELAFVEVSTDGVRYVRFPAISNSQTQTQTGAFGSTDASLLKNLAGAHLAGEGTPFDLEDLKDSLGIDIDNINYIKVIDVVGSIAPQYASLDINGSPINDPYPTPFGSSGFDLEAVGVINGILKTSTSISAFSNNDINFYPNPISQNGQLNIISKEAVTSIKLVDLTGKNYLLDTQGELTLSGFSPGVYFLEIRTDDNVLTERIVITE